jgi:hypothetical protein
MQNRFFKSPKVEIKFEVAYFFLLKNIKSVKTGGCRGCISNCRKPAYRSRHCRPEAPSNPNVLIMKKTCMLNFSDGSIAYKTFESNFEQRFPRPSIQNLNGNNYAK